VLVFAVDGTRQVARQRRLPASSDLPEARLHIQTHPWIFTGGGAGNGTPEEEVTAALESITRDLETFGLPLSMALLRLDGHCGSPVFLRIVKPSDQFFVTRSTDSPLQGVSFTTHQARLPGAAPSGFRQRRGSEPSLPSQILYYVKKSGFQSNEIFQHG
jgi:hypothetical protein